MGQPASMRGAGVVCGKSASANFQMKYRFAQKWGYSHPLDWNFENSDWYFWWIIDRPLLGRANLHHRLSWHVTDLKQKIWFCILNEHHGLHAQCSLQFGSSFRMFQVFWICTNWMAHQSSWLLPKCSVLEVFEYQIEKNDFDCKCNISKFFNIWNVIKLRTGFWSQLRTMSKTSFWELVQACPPRIQSIFRRIVEYELQFESICANSNFQFLVLICFFSAASCFKI